MIKLNLGSGTKPLKDYINIDFDNKHNPDMVVNLDKESLPFPDNSVDEIYSEHFLEHVVFIHHTISEIKRVLKVGGRFHSRVPHFSCLSAHKYDHYRTFRGGDPKDLGFKVENIELRFFRGHIKIKESRLTTVYERFMLLNHAIPCEEIYFELIK